MRSRFPIATVLATLLLLAACGQNDATQTSRNSPAANAGLVVVNHGNGAEPATLDPHLAQGTWEDSIIGDMLMGLTTEGAKGEPLPGAAEHWETSSQDFVYAWRRILNPKTTSSYAYFLYLIKNAEGVNGGKMPETALGVTAPDDKTLVVQLEHPAPYLPQYLTHFTTYPVPRHVVEAKGDAWARPGNYVGNGAFTLLEWVPNDHVTLQKNPKFWDAANVKVDRVVFYPTTDYEAALKRFRAGELDMQDRLPFAEIDWLRANMPEVIRVAPILSTEFVVANEARKPFDDVRVREALSLAIDRETITQKIRKLGETPAYGMVPPRIANYPGGVTADFKALPYPERIKRAQLLLQQAGYGPNKHLKTTVIIRSASTDALRVPAAIQAMWRAIYVDADILQNDAAIFYSKIQQGDFDIAIPAWGADFNDPSTFLDMLRKGNANNYGHFSDPKYDALLDQASKVTDLESRGQILAQAEAIAVKEHAWAPIYFWVSGAIVRPYVKGWEENPRDQHRTRWISIDQNARTAAR